MKIVGCVATPTMTREALAIVLLDTLTTIAGLPVTVTLTAVPFGTVLAMSSRTPAVVAPASVMLAAAVDAVLTVTWQLVPPNCSTQSAEVVPEPSVSPVPPVTNAIGDVEKVAPVVGALMVLDGDRVRTVECGAPESGRDGRLEDVAGARAVDRAAGERRGYRS